MNARAPVPCPEMVDIRDRIDLLDKKLVALLAERQQLIEAAGKVKPARQTVRDEARIEEVVRLVLAEARAQTCLQRLPNRYGGNSLKAVLLTNFPCSTHAKSAFQR